MSNKTKTTAPLGGRVLGCIHKLGRVSVMLMDYWFNGFLFLRVQLPFFLNICSLISTEYFGRF